LRSRLLDQVMEGLRLAPVEYLIGFAAAMGKTPAERAKWLHGLRRAAGMAPANPTPAVAELHEPEPPASPLAARPYRIELHRWQGGVMASFSVLLANRERDAIVQQLGGIAYTASVLHGRAIAAEGRQVQTGGAR
jgi:hypothetical protein